tara:strand:+ start:4923 stop:5639 length:717 start_codon:yes stop_codon:yes gene_type:complete
MYNMPARKKPVKKPKKKVTQKQKQAQKQIVNIVIGKQTRSKKRGVPRQSAAPMAQQGRFLNQFVQPNQMIPSNQINPTIVPAPFGEPLVTNPSTLSFATNAQPSIYRNMRREAPTSSKVNASFAWSGKSGAMTDALPPTPRLTDRQAKSVSAAKAVARSVDSKFKAKAARNQDAERAMMGAADTESFMMNTPLPNFGYRTPAASAVVEPTSQPSNDPFPSASSQGGGVIMEGRSLFKD